MLKILHEILIDFMKTRYGSEQKIKYIVITYIN